MCKRITVACCCGLILLAGWALGENKESGNDGARWKILTPFERNLYVLGFSRGCEQGVIDAASSALVAQMQSKQPPSLTPEGKKQALDIAAKAKKHSLMLGSHSTMNRVTDTMSTFYDDFRNMPVCWEDAVMFSTASLARASPRQTKKWTLHERRALKVAASDLRQLPGLGSTP